jgi:hypothetical protein
MALRQVRPGLYVRTDSPRYVKITREFADAINANSQSTMLAEIVTEALRAQESPEKHPRK